MESYIIERSSVTGALILRLENSNNEISNSLYENEEVTTSSARERKVSLLESLLSRKSYPLLEGNSKKKLKFPRENCLAESLFQSNCSIFPSEAKSTSTVTWTSYSTYKLKLESLDAKQRELEESQLNKQNEKMEKLIATLNKAQSELSKKFENLSNEYSSKTKNEAMLKIKVDDLESEVATLKSEKEKGVANYLDLKNTLENFIASSAEREKLLQEKISVLEINYQKFNQKGKEKESDLLANQNLTSKVELPSNVSLISFETGSPKKNNLSDYQENRSEDEKPSNYIPKIDQNSKNNYKQPVIIQGAEKNFDVSTKVTIHEDENFKEGGIYKPLGLSTPPKNSSHDIALSEIKQADHSVINISELSFLNYSSPLKIKETSSNPDTFEIKMPQGNDENQSKLKPTANLFNLSSSNFSSSTQDSIIQNSIKFKGGIFQDSQLRQADPSETIVYRTYSGQRYHRNECEHLANSKFEIKLKDVRNFSLPPCLVCCPPNMELGGSDEYINAKEIVMRTVYGKCYHTKSCTYGYSEISLLEATKTLRPCSFCNPPLLIKRN